MQKTPIKASVENSALIEPRTPPKEPIEKSDLIQNFQPGDLLYGLEVEARTQFRGYIEKKFVGSEAKVLYLTIDDINKELSKEYMFKSETSSPKKSARKYHPLVEKHLQAWKGNAKYSPTMIQGESEKSEKKAFIYSCKVALLSHEQKIHFCLDNFNSDAIRDKGHKHYKSYTSKELRLCAKQWEKIKNRVDFYQGGKLCPHPWGDSKPLDWLADVKKGSSNADLIQADQSYTPPLNSSQRFFKLNSDASPDDDNRGKSTPDSQEITDSVRKKLFN